MHVLKYLHIVPAFIRLRKRKDKKDKDRKNHPSRAPATSPTMSGTNNVIDERVFDALNIFHSDSNDGGLSHNGSALNLVDPRLDAEIETVDGEAIAQLLEAGEGIMEKSGVDTGHSSRSQASLRSLDYETYGSNEDVYNPYKPFTSKEYINQEVAAGRMKPTEGQSSYQPMRGASTSTSTSHQHRTAEDKTASLRFEALMARLKQNTHTPTSAPGSKNDAMSQALRSFQHPYQSLAEDSDGYDAEADSDPGEPLLQSLPTTLRVSTPQTGDSFVGGSHTPANANTQPRQPVRLEPSTITRRSSKHRTKFVPLPQVDPIPRTSSRRGDASTDSDLGFGAPMASDRKRRRPGSSPQIPVPPPPLPGRIGGFLQRAGSTARRSSTSASGSSGLVLSEPPISVSSHPQSLLRSNPSSHAGHRITLPRDLPDYVRQHIGQYLDPALFAVNAPMGLLLPPWQNLRTRALLFTSEIIPSNFNPAKRQSVLNILRTKAPYVPACISLIPTGPNIQYHLNIRPTPSSNTPSMQRIDHSVHQEMTWPLDRIPVEVFHDIAKYLSRKDLESMRLVNTEFEGKISNPQFRSVVVGFRPEIYGMMVHDQKSGQLGVVDVKGKGKAKELPLEQDDVVQEIYDGMKVFQAWGSHIKKFAMAFEVDEDQLIKPPVKGKYQDFTTFWGLYKWPHPHYRRYEFCAGLEKKADEYSCMSAALSNLEKTQELGLSLDSGLGWLAGPDISDRAQIFKEEPRIFGSTMAQSQATQAERRKMWNDIVSTLSFNDGSDYTISESLVFKGNIPIIPDQQGFYQANVTIPSNYRRYECSRTLTFDQTPAQGANRPLVFQGVSVSNNAASTTGTPIVINIHDPSQGSKESPFSTASIIPNKLTTAQKEWLLETEWAQRAFISSYCMALTDNSHTFANVHSLNIAKLSSKHLSSLQREDFWTALPQLNNLTFLVSADFRNIYKNDAGVVESSDIQPSGAATQFSTLLKSVIARVKNIKTMRLGYSGGGEHQTGIFGRNQFVMPAPLVNYTESSVFWQTHRDVLALPHVEHLTLENCWIAPPILKTFVAHTRRAKLRTLTLDSVSLSAHPGVPDHVESDPTQDCVFSAPRGPPRPINDPHLGNLFQHRPLSSDPVPGQTDAWMYTAGRVGSWANVIDSISPGPTRDLIRYAFQYLEDPPPRRDSGSLEQLTFKSCGYVRLGLSTLDQSALMPVVNSPPLCLQNRALELMPVMMHRKDDLLSGQIVPALSDAEQVIFRTAFPMQLGWGDDESKFDNLEDGQPEGGSGRFSGSVEKLVFPVED